MIDPRLLAAIVAAIEEEEKALKPEEKRVRRNKPIYLAPGGSSQPSDPIGDALRADVVIYYLLETNLLDSKSNHIDLISPIGSPVSFSNNWCVMGNPAGAMNADNANIINFGDVDFTVCYEFMRSSDLLGFGAVAFSSFPNPFELDIEITGSGNPVFFEKQSDGNNIDIAIPQTTVENDVLHLAIVWYRSSDKTAYVSVDNLIGETGSFPPGTTITNTGASISLQLGGTEGFKVRHFGIWERVLIPTEIDYLWDNGNGRSLYP